VQERICPEVKINFLDERAMSCFGMAHRVIKPRTEARAARKPRLNAALRANQ